MSHTCGFAFDFTKSILDSLPPSEVVGVEPLSSSPRTDAVASQSLPPKSVVTVELVGCQVRRRRFARRFGTIDISGRCALEVEVLNEAERREMVKVEEAKRRRG